MGNDWEIMSQVSSFPILKYYSHSDYNRTLRYCTWSIVQAEGHLRAHDKNQNNQMQRLTESPASCYISF
jgi:hypothetical protein